MENRRTVAADGAQEPQTAILDMTARRWKFSGIVWRDVNDGIDVFRALGVSDSVREGIDVDERVCW
jgi:hypothetical protein